MTNWIDPLLRDTLNGRAAGAPSTSCLDAETAAAFAEHALPAQERTRVEAHVADCARCQALLAALVSTMPPEAARAWWRRPAVAWLVPAAVAATAFIVWINIPPREGVAPRVPTAPEISQQPRSDSIPTPPPAAAAPPEPSAQNSVAARSAAPIAGVGEQARDREALQKEAPAAAAAELPAQDAVLPSEPLQESAFAFQTTPTVTSESRREAVAEGAPAQAAPAPAAPAQGAAEPSMAETVTLADRSMGSMARRLEAPALKTIVSSNSISRWRIDAPGIVQHSADGGATWQPQATGTDTTLTAGSSPSPSVCWLVGAGGIVLITTDEGRSWQRVPFPVAADLLSVRATDDRTATVVTADRRTFRTSDRGIRWTR